MGSKNIIAEKTPFKVHKHIPMIVESLNRASTFFLFRANGDEIEFTTIGGKLESKYHILNSSEINYINKKIIDNDTNRTKI